MIHEIFSISNVHCGNAYESKAEIFQLLCISQANLAVHSLHLD